MSSAVFEYAYRNPDSQVAQELFAIYDDVDYSDLDDDDFSNSQSEHYKSGGTDSTGKKPKAVPQTLTPDERMAQSSQGKRQPATNRTYVDGIKQAKGIGNKIRAFYGKGWDNKLYEEAQAKKADDKKAAEQAKKEAEEKKRLAKQANSKEAKAAAAKVDSGETKTLPSPAGSKPNFSYDDYLEYELNEDFSEYEHFAAPIIAPAVIGAYGLTAAGAAGAATGGFFGVKEILRKIQENKAIKEAERIALEKAEEKARLMGNLKVAGIIAGALAAIGGGAALGRHVYLKHRMKQTGAKSKADVKKIIATRKATKNALLGKGASKADIKAALKKQFGY